MRKGLNNMQILKKQKPANQARKGGAYKLLQVLSV